MTTQLLIPVIAGVICFCAGFASKCRQINNSKNLSNEAYSSYIRQNIDYIKSNLGKSVSFSHKELEAFYEILEKAYDFDSGSNIAVLKSMIENNNFSEDDYKKMFEALSDMFCYEKMIVDKAK